MTSPYTPLFLILLIGLSFGCDDLIEPPSDLGPAIDTPNYQLLEADSLEMYQWLTDITAYPHRRVGSSFWESAMIDLEEKLQEIGFSDLQKDFFPIQYWACDNWSLSVNNGEDEISIPSFFEQGSGFTTAEGLTAEMIYVGRQIEPEEAAAVSGKIVVADLEFSDDVNTGLPNPVSRPNHRSFPEDNLLSAGDVYWEAKEAGAIAVLFIMADFHANVSEYMYIPHHDDLRELPSQFVGNRDGIKLRCYAQEGWSAKIVQEGTYETRQTYNLWVELPGQTEDNIIVSTHVDSPFQGVIEDGSGVISVLAQAKEWLAKPLNERPKSLYFVFTAAHIYKDSPGGAVFVNQHPEIVEKTKVLVEIEHLGAIRQAIERDEFVPTNLLSPIGIYHSVGSYVEAEMLNMINNYPPPNDGIDTVEPFFLFPYPLTEAAGWVFQAKDQLNQDLEYVSFITNPSYLLTLDDNFDKIDFSAVLGANESIYQLSKNYMDNL